MDRPTRISGQSRTIMMPVRRMLRSPAYKLFSSGLTFALQTAANSAGDPLDPPVEVASTQWEVRLQKNVPSLPGWFLNPLFQNGVNAADQIIVISGVNYTMPAGYAKLSNLTFSEIQYENDYTFVTISWNVTFQTPRPAYETETAVPGPWDVERLDEGMRIRKKKGTSTDNTHWESVKDSTGVYTVTTPVPFDGKGKKLMTDGDTLSEEDLWRFCYRPFGERVDYSVMPWS